MSQCQSLSPSSLSNRASLQCTHWGTSSNDPSAQTPPTQLGDCIEFQTPHFDLALSSCFGLLENQQVNENLKLFVYFCFSHCISNE